VDQLAHHSPSEENRTREPNAGAHFCRESRGRAGSDDGPIFSTVAKLVEALKRSIPEGTQNAERRNEALRLARDLVRGTKYEEE
jgi:hypothetical protein